MNPNSKGAILALVAFAIFAAHDVIVKFLGANYSAFQIVFFSVLFSFPMVTLLLIRDATPGHLRPVHLWWTLIRTISVVITAFSAFYAFSVLPLAQVYAILFAAPLLITILSVPILGETVGLRRGIAVVVGLIGVLVVLRPGGADLSIGHLAALVAAVGSALASIIVRKIGPQERDVVLMLYPLIANFIVMGALLPSVYVPMPLPHLGALFLMSIMAFVSTALVIAAYKQGEAVIIAPMQYSQILWAVLYGAIFFDEFPDIWTAIGAGIIIASGVYIVLRESSSQTSDTRPVLRSRTRFETGITPRARFFQRATKRWRSGQE